jgi:hypothetical protein
LSVRHLLQGYAKLRRLSAAIFQDSRTARQFVRLVQLTDERSAELLLVKHGPDWSVALRRSTYMHVYGVSQLVQLRQVVEARRQACRTLVRKM